MIKLVSTLILFLPLLAVAESASVEWPSRNSKVICGGTVDDENLDMKVVLPNELMRAESKDGRILLYVDLRKPGQMRLAISDAVSDESFAKREAILAKLSPEEADLVRSLFSTRVTDLYVGFTENFAHFTTAFEKHSLSLSCQEVFNEKN